MIREHHSVLKSPTRLPRKLVLRRRYRSGEKLGGGGTDLIEARWLLQLDTSILARAYRLAFRRVFNRPTSSDA